MQTHGALNRDTHLYPSHNNSSVPLTTTTYVRRSGRLTNGIWGGRTTPQDSVFSFPTTPASSPPRMTLSRKAWVWFNCLHTRVGHVRSCLYKWGVVSSAACECGTEEQTVDHVVFQYPSHRPHYGLHGLTVLDDLRQSNGGSTPAPRSGAAKQWLNI